jgi:hypothetical protein
MLRERLKQRNQIRDIGEEARAKTYAQAENRLLDEASVGRKAGQTEFDMTSDYIHTLLAQMALGCDPSEDDALALMIVLHTHRIRLREAILQDRPGVTELAAITRSGAAEAVATIWPNRSDRLRTDFRYWSHAFNTQTPYELVEDIPQEWMTPVQRVLRCIAENPLVKGLEPED